MAVPHKGGQRHNPGCTLLDNHFTVPPMAHKSPHFGPGCLVVATVTDNLGQRQLPWEVVQVEDLIVLRYHAILLL